jgi:hypothetical protein
MILNWPAFAKPKINNRERNQSVPSFSVMSHPSAQNRLSLRLIYHWKNRSLSRISSEKVVNDSNAPGSSHILSSGYDLIISEASELADTLEQMPPDDA